MGVELSVVVNVDAWEWIRDAAACLERQTIAPSIELVLVCPSAARLGMPADPAPRLGAVRVVESPILPVGHGRAAGIRVASGKLIVIGETHVFPEPSWGEMLLAAYGRGHAAIVPLIGNANPSALTWGSLLMDYGRWCSAAPGELSGLPRNNVAVGRAELFEACGGRLEEVLGPVDDLAAALALVGGSAVREPKAKLQHLNVLPLSGWIRERLLIGRMVGSSRAAGWSGPRRLAYAAAWPAIAATIGLRGIRLGRLAGRLSPRVVGALALAALVQGIGEAHGYLRPDMQGAEAQMFPYEVHKLAFAGNARRHTAAFSLGPGDGTSGPA